jgi:3-isopropylmalate/(R)-2-methylmalate dehydratase small subunit
VTGVDLHPRGRTWVFGDGVNTDEMYPGFAMRLSHEEAARHMFNATRPDWPELVRPGDVLVGGRRFGLGSARPVPVLLKILGISCVLADEFTSLFLRNCINHGLPVLAVPGVSAAFAEGQHAEVDIEQARVVNVETGQELTGRRYPDLVLDLLRHGGVVPDLVRRGLIAEEAA